MSKRLVIKAVLLILALQASYFLYLHIYSLALFAVLAFQSVSIDLIVLETKDEASSVAATEDRPKEPSDFFHEQYPGLSTSQINQELQLQGLAANGATVRSFGSGPRPGYLVQPAP